MGTTYIIDHQVLSGLGEFRLISCHISNCNIVEHFQGYCFSASAPPLLTQAAITALDRFEREPSIFEELRTTSKKLHE